MLLKIYAFTWAVMIVIAGAMFATGMLNEFTITALGFIFPALFFAGLFGVLPWMMDRHYARHIRPELPALAPAKRMGNRRQAPGYAAVPSAAAALA